QLRQSLVRVIRIRENDVFFRGDGGSELLRIQVPARSHDRAALSLVRPQLRRNAGGAEGIRLLIFPVLFSSQAATCDEEAGKDGDPMRKSSSGRGTVHGTLISSDAPACRS